MKFQEGLRTFKNFQDKKQVPISSKKDKKIQENVKKSQENSRRSKKSSKVQEDSRRFSKL